MAYHPTASISPTGTIEFICLGASDEYVDLSRTTLNISVAVKKKDGKDLVDADLVAPINGFAHAFFSQVDLYFNDHLVSAPSSLYPYRCYLEQLLNYNGGSKATQLKTGMWSKDTKGAMDTCGDANAGFKERAGLIAKSKICNLEIPLHLDTFHQSRLLINNVDIHLRFVRSKPEFVLMNAAGTEYSIDINHAILTMEKVKIADSTRLLHATKIHTVPAKYPLNRVEMKTFSIPSGLQNHVIPNAYLGQLPARLIMGFVESASMTGSYKKNPFNFQHFDVNHFTLYVDGDAIPAQPFRPDYAEGKYMREYTSLLTAIGKWQRDESIGISPEEFANGYTLYAFDLTGDGFCEAPHFNLIKNGSIRLEIQFSTALLQPINAVILSEFQNLLEIDEFRNVVFDYMN